MPDRLQEHLDEIAASANGPWSPKAFDCANCPGNGCPAWWAEKWERVDEEGIREVRVTEGCGFRLAQGMFVRAIGATEIVRGAVLSRTDELAKKQDAQTGGIRQALQMMLLLAAKASGNPAAVAAAPVVPKIAAAFRKLLPGKKDR